MRCIFTYSMYYKLYEHQHIEEYTIEFRINNWNV